MVVVATTAHATAPTASLERHVRQVSDIRISTYLAAVKSVESQVPATYIYVQGTPCFSSSFPGS